VWQVTLLLFAMSGAACQRTGPPPQVDRFDADLTLTGDGTLRVVETIRIGASAASFDREVSGPTDGVRFESSTVDGRRVDANGTDGVLRIVEGRRLRAHWSFASSASAPHVLTFAYRAAATVAVSGPRGRLEWPAVPGGRRYGIGASDLVLTVQPPLALYDGSGIAQAGWTVERRPAGLAASRVTLAPGEAGTFILELGIDPAVIVEPAWQTAEAWQRDLSLAFISGALFILVVAAGSISMIWWQYPARGPRVPAAEGAVIVSGLRRTGWICLVVAALFSLAVWRWMPDLGGWLQAIPASLAIAGFAFAIASAIFRRRARAEQARPGA
jgi:hypothetical protein